MSFIAQNDFFSIVLGRHSIKQFDASYNLNEQEIQELLKTASHAPSSWNLQHWMFLAIHNQSAKEKLLPIAYGQKQVVEASVVVTILGDTQANLNAEDVLAPDVKAGLLPETVKSNLIGQIEAAYAASSTYPRDEAIRNASLAAMQLMLAVKAKGLDSCPMGGYDAGQLIEAFDIPPRYIPVMLIAIGKQAVPARSSSRYPVEKKIVWNGF